MAAAWRPRVSRLVSHEGSTRHASGRRWCFVGRPILEVCYGFTLVVPRADQTSSVIFQYPGFSVTYESGIDDIPRFDAYIEVYSMKKSVRVFYDTPFIKGLPVTLLVRENVDGTYKESIVRKTYEDPYTLEMKELYDMVANGKAVKTTAKDAKEDLKIFRMIMKAGYRLDGHQ